MTSRTLLKALRRLGDRLYAYAYATRSRPPKSSKLSERPPHERRRFGRR